MSRRLRQAGLVAIVAATTGCRWIPARRGESRPETPPPVIGKSELAKSSETVVADATLPPLPPLRSISDEEAFQPSAPTPLLDAAAARDAALQRVLALDNDPPHRNTPAVEVRPITSANPESTDDPVTPEAEKKPKADDDVAPAAFDPKTLPVQGSPDVVPVPKSPQEPAMPPISEPPPAEAEPTPAAKSVPETPKSAESQDSTLWDTVMAALATPQEPEAIAEPSSEIKFSQLPVIPEFAVSDMRLCKKVIGFGRTEPLSSSSCKPGQTVLLYCELEGLSDEETADWFRSRLSSTVVILPASGGAAVWSEDLGIAEDHCRRRRRDFFVNYRITLPTGLPAGQYQIRLTQKDLLADREASRTLPLSVSP